MKDRETDLQRAVALHQQGQIDAAEPIYRRLLEELPGDAHVRQLLGLVAYQRGNFAAAAGLIEEAIRVVPGAAEFHNNLGEVYRAQNRWPEAAGSIRRALELNSAYPAAHNNLGLVQGALVDRVGARASYEAAIRLAPGYGEAWCNLGRLEQVEGKLSAAIACFERGVAVQPGSASAHGLLGQARSQLGDRSGAIAALREAIRLDANFVEAHYNLGIALLDQPEPEAAMEQFLAARTIRPELPEVYDGLGLCARALGRFEEALRHFGRAVEIKPDFADGYTHRGRLYQALGDNAAALADYRKAIEVQPAFVPALNSLGSLLLDIGQIGTARAAFRRALAAEPNLKGTRLNLASVLLFEGRADEAVAIYKSAIGTPVDSPAVGDHLLYSMMCSASFTAAESASQHRGWAERYAGKLARFALPPRRGRGHAARLRVGYVSPDFYDHAVAHFLLPLLSGHDRGRFEIFAYSDVAKRDEMTGVLEAATEHWRTVFGWSDQRLGGQIMADGIDILIDLSGHTARNRLLLFARKPAPLQVSYLGYPNTTGLETMDYRVVDRWSDPAGLTDPHCSEQLWRLPDTAWCYCRPQGMAGVEPSPRLVAGELAFGSFNNLAKVSPLSVKLWAEILRAVPHARLVLKAAALADDLMQQEVCARFEREGVTSGRLVFSPWTRTVREHLEYYYHVDLALDTFPYHGTTTTCEALWMGVPVVTLAGESHHSRVGVSLLTNVGWPELIAKSPEEYVRVAVELANAPRRLEEIRAGLRDRMAASPLMNEAVFVRQFESALSAMWERRQDGRTENQQRT